METKVSSVTENNAKAYKEAAKILKNGGLVAFPTETVYGLGGNALDEEAAKHIYAAKGRPSDNPLIIHIAEKEALKVLAKDIPEVAWKLAEVFWPGPLTMVLSKQNIVPYGTTGGLIKTLDVGEELTRTGKSTSADESGYYWSRVTYNGTTGYVITSGLTTEKPVVEEPTEEPVKNEVENKVENTANEVVNNAVNEIDGNELTKITEEIGVIPEVGNNIMVNFLFGSIVVSIIMMIIVKKNKYEE